MNKNIISLLFIISHFLFLPAFAGEQHEQEENLDNSVVVDRIGTEDLRVEIPSVIFTFKDAEIVIRFNNPNHTKLLASKGELPFIINGEEKILHFENGSAHFPVHFETDGKLSIYAEDFSFNTKVNAYPIWVILVPLMLLAFFIIRRRPSSKKE